MPRGGPLINNGYGVIAEFKKFKITLWINIKKDKRFYMWFSFVNLKKGIHEKKGFYKPMSMYGLSKMYIEVFLSSDLDPSI